jgi:plasmid replication initiation protein
MEREWVCQSNDLVKAQYRLPLLAKKVFSKGIAKLNPKGNSLIAIFNAKDFAEDFEINDPNLGRKIMQAAEDCMHMALTLNKGNEQIICRIFHYVKINKETKEIEIHFADPLRDELLQLKKNYTPYLIENVINLSNVSHIRLFETLKSKQNLKGGIWRADFPGFIIDLGLPKSYCNFSNLQTKFLLPAQRELREHTDLSFDFEPVRSGKRIVGIKFHVKKSDRDMESEPSKPKPTKDNQVRRKPGYAEPKPNYQPAKLETNVMTDEEVEAARLARIEVGKLLNNRTPAQVT